jgi:hypothetical protein
MSNIGRIFRENLPEFQGIVENQLEVSLGKLRALPIWCYPFAEFDYDQDISLRDNLGSLINDFRVYYAADFDSDSCYLGKAGNKAVYYGQRAADRLWWKDKECKKTLLHELYHIGLARYGGYGDVMSEELESDLPDHLDEAFSELMATRTLKEMGMNVKSRSMRTICIWLSNELKKDHKSEPKEIAEFVYSRKGQKCFFEDLDSLSDFEKRLDSYLRRAYH